VVLCNKLRFIKNMNILAPATRSRIPFAAVVALSAPLCLSANSANAQFHDLTIPGGDGVTQAYGIDGSHVIGTFLDPFGISHGFSYDVTTHVYGVFDATLGVNGTTANGIDGVNRVGSYLDNVGMQHGFVFDGTSYNTVDMAGAANGTTVTGISGNLIVGQYTDIFNPLFFGTPATSSFVMDLTTNAVTQVDAPDALASANNTLLNAVSGNTAVGSYTGSDGMNHGVIYDIFTGQYTTVDDPFAAQGTALYGILGNDIVGTYIDAGGLSHGLIYDIATGSFQTIDNPNGYSTIITGMAVSNNIFNPNPVFVGYYLALNGNSTNTYGFWFQEPTPEPGTWALFAGLATAAGAVSRRRKTKRA